MKLYRYLMTLATLVLVACSQDDSIPMPQPDAVDIRASIVFGNMTGGFTRSNPLDESTSTAFSNNDVIAVTTDDNQGTAKYTLNGDEWKAEEGKELKWTKESLTFTAWYPATEGTSATSFTLPTTLSEDNIANWDYMTANIENATKESGVNLAFTRKMALVVIDGITIDETIFGTSVSVSSITLHSNTCGYENGNVKTGTSAIIMLSKEGKYYAIVSPTTEDASTIFLTVTLSNDETATVKGIPALTDGNKYTYSLNIGRESVATSLSVSPWTESTAELGLEGGLSYTISADGGTYTVYRAHGLMPWNAAVQNQKTLNLTLGADIDMNGVTGWQQVTDYTGSIKGDGFTISGLNMNVSGTNAGLVAKLGSGGKIINLNLAGLTVTGSATNVGGLVGENNGGTIGACSVTGAVTASSATNVGGLVGLNSNNGLVLSSYCTGAVSGGTNATTGDIAGTNSATITGCYHGNSLIGVGVGTGNVTKVGNETGMKWIPVDNNDNGAMNIMNSKMNDDLKSQLGNKFGWIANNASDKNSRPLIIDDDARFDVKDYIMTTSLNNKDTYEVYTAAGLIAWNTSLKKNKASNLKLMDDINMSGKSWVVYGDSDSSGFTGIIDGNGKTVTALSITQNRANNGFIGHNTGTIKHLHIRDLELVGSNYVGGVAGRNNGTIIGCSVSGTITASGYGVGGVVGVMDEKGELVACYNMASVISSIKNAPKHGDGNGGVIGRISAGEAIMTACYNTGKVDSKSPGTMKTGFVIGRNNNDEDDIKVCYWEKSQEDVEYSSPNAGIGIGKGGITEITNNDWSSALTTMNSAITSYGYQYVTNGNSTTEPLKLVKTGN